MNKTINFAKRNLKELLRDPLMYVFCLGFPIAMFFLFFFINKYSGGNTPTFEVKSLTPGIIVFSYSFIMLTLALIVSKDRQTFFLKRLYSSPMKDYDFILGYSIVGFIIGVIQDSVETALNSSGDVMFTATAEFMEWKKQGKSVYFTEKEKRLQQNQ